MFREDEMTEFKKTTGELNEAMISISAILNKHGKGNIYFGLKNDGTPNYFTITDSTLRDVSRKIFESIKPQIYPRIQTEIIDGIEVIRVDFEGKERPYSAFGKYYKRIADEDRELTPSELRNIMISQEYEEHWENKTSAEDVSDVSLSTLNNFYKNATSCGRLPELGDDPALLMRKLGLLNGQQLTNAGRILFSKNKPITLKMAVFATEHKTTFLDISRVEGNIFELIDAATSYIVRNIRWSSQLGADGIHRIETPEIPLGAIREAVVNSFAHARYDSSVQHEIDIFSNRISILNPGSFANSFSPEDFANRDLHSFLRNESVAKALYLCKDVETFGSGLRKIYSLCKDAGVEVSYHNTETDFAITFDRRDTFIAPSDGTINGMINGTITELDSAILSLIKDNIGITIPELAESCQKSIRSINRAMTSLKTKGLIVRVGSNKTGHWKAV